MPRASQHVDCVREPAIVVFFGFKSAARVSPNTVRLTHTPYPHARAPSRFFFMSFVNTILDRRGRRSLCGAAAASVCASAHGAGVRVRARPHTHAHTRTHTHTIAHSLGSSLVITAVGGGTEVIPFLTGARDTLHFMRNTRRRRRTRLDNQHCPPPHPTFNPPARRSVRRVAVLVRVPGALLVRDAALFARRALQHRRLGLPALLRGVRPRVPAL